MSQSDNQSDRIESSLEIHKGIICFLLKFLSLFYQLPQCEYLLHGGPSWHEASLLDSLLASEKSGTAVQEVHNEELPGHREECDTTIIGADSATAFPFPERQNDACLPVYLESILHEILWKTVFGAREGSKTKLDLTKLNLK